MLLKTSCGNCHGKKPSGGAPNTILGYDDLTATSFSDPSKTVAERAVARMKSTKRPMPPDGNLGPNEIDILDKWIAEGMPKGSCGPPTIQDAGATTHDDPNAQPPAPPLRTGICTSGATAPPDLVGSAMHPGMACITCHTAMMGPSFTAAGTVYPTSTEPDDCNGSVGPIADAGATASLKVLMIDANGAIRSLPVNAVGNFSTPTAFAPPYRAMLVRGNSIREMKAAQTEGDCNTCHSEFGAHDAPGRLLEP